MGAFRSLAFKEGQDTFPVMHSSMESSGRSNRSTIVGMISIVEAGKSVTMGESGPAIQ